MDKIASSYAMWNPFTLRQAKENLLSNGLNEGNSMEVRVLSYLINYDCNLQEKKDIQDFAKIYAENNRLFEDEYQDYMQYIIDAQDKQTIYKCEPYKKLDVSYEYIMAKLDLFMDKLNPEWYQLFVSIYNNRKDIIRLSTDETETLYLPTSDLWLANIERKDTIEDYSLVAQVFAEGIATKLRRDADITPDDYVFINAFAKAIQYLFMAKLDDYGIQSEVNKFFTNDYNKVADDMNILCGKYYLNACLARPKTPKDISTYLKKAFGRNIYEASILEAYKDTVRKDIQSALAHLILRELLLIYEEDQDKFIYDMNALVKSEDTPGKTLEKLNINLNSIYYR